MILRYFLSYLLTIPVLVILDLLWVGYVMKDFYRGHLGHLHAPQTNVIAVVLFYIAFSLGLYYFAVYQGLSRQSLFIAVFSGFLFGAAAYATYDLTNMATLKDWPFLVVVVDVAWGAVLSAIVAGIGFFIGQEIVN